MSADPRTIAVYSARAADYDALFDGQDDPQLQAFMQALPDGARVLDQGCGPGHAAARMLAAGFRVDAFDAAPEMVERARARGVRARIATFDDPLDAGRYNGIWSSFSLLHARRGDLPRHLAAMKASLVPGGLLAIALKTGTGEHRDDLDRRYAYYSERELGDLLAAAGFTAVSLTQGRSRGLAGKSDPWIAVLARA